MGGHTRGRGDTHGGWGTHGGAHTGDGGTRGGRGGQAAGVLLLSGSSMAAEGMENLSTHPPEENDLTSVHALHFTSKNER